MSGGQIIVSRDPEGWADRFRTYRVILDDEPVGRIRRGETLTLPVASGSHRLHLSIAWTRSEVLNLEIEAGEQQRIRCWPNAQPQNALLWSTVRRNRYIGIVRVTA